MERKKKSIRRSDVKRMQVTFSITKEIEPRAGALISRELEIQDESIYCDESVFVDGVDF